jgi:hypothetical protein
VKNFLTIAGIVIVLSLSEISFAGVPFTNLEGDGGAAFNPFAYPANSGSAIKDADGKDTIFSKPQLGVWYVNLGTANIDWTSLGITETIGKRLELSYARETVAVGDPVNVNFTKHNLGAKYLVLDENAFGDWSPAIAVGGIYKHTDPLFFADTDDHGYDIYAVATKFITQGLPVPVLLSGGVRNTNSRVTGVLGYDHDRDTVLFGNVDVIVVKDVAVGFEYQQGAEFSNSGFNNADYYDVHVAWLVNPNVSLIAAYVNTGKYSLNADKFGLGEGVVASLQYAF